MAAEGPTADRRSDRDRRALILDATRELLVEGGVQRLTIEGVAARAGVAKTTIYRRWKSKDELAFAVLLELVDLLAVPDTGDTRRELIYLVESVVRVLGSTMMGGVMRGLVSDLAADPERQEAFRERVVIARVGELRKVVERGVARGDLRPDTDGDLLYELLLGPVYFRLLLSGGPLEDPLAERLVDAVLPGFTPAAGGGTSSPPARRPAAAGRRRSTRSGS
jgi:AcrR family transcriptional regulator